MRHLLVVTALALGLGCAQPKPRPAPEAPKCMRLDRVQGTTVEVTCAGSDQDQDGLDDAADLCPTAAESKNSKDDLDGCPDPDADGDLLADEVDDCPRQAGPAPTGCPILDGDQDGFVDHLDSCPLDPEDLNGVEDQDGCPEGADVVVVLRDDAIYIKQPVHFLKKSAMLLPDSKDLLERVGTQLKRHEDRIARVRVVGHVDSREVRGNKAEALARTRARIVARYLIAQGLDKDAFETEALGSKKPLNKGRTARDREKNQRVELLVTLKPSTVPELAAVPATRADAGAPDAASGTTASATTATTTTTTTPASGTTGSSSTGGNSTTASTSATGSASTTTAATTTATTSTATTSTTSTTAAAGSEPAVKPYDENEEWDEEFLDDDWDEKFLQKD